MDYLFSFLNHQASFNIYRFVLQYLFSVSKKSFERSKSSYFFIAEQEVHCFEKHSMAMNAILIPFGLKGQIKANAIFLCL